MVKILAGRVDGVAWVVAPGIMLVAIRYVGSSKILGPSSSALPQFEAGGWLFISHIASMVSISVIVIIKTAQIAKSFCARALCALSS